MQLRIVHTTGYTYDARVGASFNEARLTPQTSTGQIVSYDRVEVSPKPWVYTYRDYWGTAVTAFEVFDPHDSLTVTATATVHTDRAPAPGPTLTWTDLADPDLLDEHTEYLTVPARVEPPTDLVQRCRELVGTQAPSAVARAVCDLVHDEIEYVSGSTDVATSAADAWTRRSGVCQDIAHLVIGALRSLGIPARYVSGYLHPDAEAVVGESVRGESHAWVEWWDGQWVGFDPTNATGIDDHHVVVAAGRDYDDVRPLHGIFSGSGSSEMFVDVEITRVH
ncbi:hypothetical protein GCM10011519_00210 [Marmoricola endophyticus]|uniref:Transglutaminase-like domain-containing protein n=1 Tax=Marmoricola endophyticus TaxID=2040280 RepID=A0A917B8X2_9ACTN|nr:transglutaminase family protein [Marmoricola endophyticus]GGF30740.1 hypothetical protein GCM10011519_00210 [Marmoricola endophyticus]